MMKKLLLLGLVLVLFAAPAYAETITYDIIRNYRQPGFMASVLRTASRPGPDGYAMSGHILTRLEGRLTGDWSGSSLSGLGGVLHTNWRGVDILFSNGSFNDDGGSFHGQIDYAVRAGHHVKSLGTFFFASQHGINAISQDHSEFTLWGQTWVPGGKRFGGLKLGIDLRGEGQPVPEPGTLALLALGVCGVAARRRRRTAPAS